LQVPKDYVGIKYEVWATASSMNKLGRTDLTSALLAESLILILVIGFANGEPPTPPPPQQSWNPPNEGVAGGQSHYDMAGYSIADRLNVWTADKDGNPKKIFSLNEQAYLYVDTPVQWMDNYLWLYEYHQSNTSSGRWRFWRREIGFGRFVFGPFSPDESQPAGNYTWKAWLLEPKSMTYQDKVVTFTYGETIPEFAGSAVLIVFIILLAFCLVLNKLNASYFRRESNRKSLENLAHG
jgi:hypothetical protein